MPRPIDIQCPRCGELAGRRCGGSDDLATFCMERIEAAEAETIRRAGDLERASERLVKAAEMVAAGHPACAQKIGSLGVTCPLPQRGLIHWPGGEPVACCEPHIAWARKVAEVLGFTLHVEITHPAPGDDLEQRFSLLEME